MFYKLYEMNNNVSSSQFSIGLLAVTNILFIVVLRFSVSQNIVLIIDLIIKIIITFK